VNIHTRYEDAQEFFFSPIILRAVSYTKELLPTDLLLSLTSLAVANKL